MTSEEIKKLKEKQRKYLEDWLSHLKIAKGGSTGVECQELVRQKQNRSSLISRLSDILKDREVGSATNLDNVWIQVINHIYTVLGLIALPNG